MKKAKGSWPHFIKRDLAGLPLFYARRGMLMLRPAAVVLFVQTCFVLCSREPIRSDVSRRSAVRLITTAAVRIKA